MMHYKFFIFIIKCTGCHPYLCSMRGRTNDDDMCLFNRSQNGTIYDANIKNVTLKSFLSKLISINVYDRESTDMVFEHPYLHGTNWEEVKTNQKPSPLVKCLHNAKRVTKTNASTKYI